jgi:LPS O-antigen subunit length determinant protein (WzzB/FepE family)
MLTCLDGKLRAQRTTFAPFKTPIPLDMQDQDYQKNFDSTNLIMFLLRYRKPLIIISFAAAVVSSVVSLLIQEKYLSTVILFPAATNSISKSLMVEDFSGKQDINAFGEEEEAEQLLQILNSDEIEGYIREKYNLMKHYGYKPDEKFALTNTVKEYQDNVTFKRTEFNSVRIDVLDHNKDTAAMIANDISDRLDYVRTRMQHERAQQGLRIIEQAYLQMQEYMKGMEDSLTTIRRMGLTDFEVEIEQLTKAYYEALAKGNTSVVNQLQKKIDIFQEYGSAYLSLTENLEFEREQLALLRAKYEETKADAEESLTTKFVVNKAWAAEKKAYPIRWLIVLVSTLSAFLVSVLGIIAIENFKKFKISE